MKKLLIIAILLVCSISVFAQPRIDVGIDVPFYFGISFGDAGSTGSYSEYAFLFPEIDASYIIDLAILKIGVGVRMFSFIVLTLGWPNVLAEMELGPVVLCAQMGGGAYFVFGLLSDFGTGPLFMGDISAAFKFTDWFRAGVGAMGIFENDPDLIFSEAGVVPFVVYAFGKFTFDLGGKKE